MEKVIVILAISPVVALFGFLLWIIWPDIKQSLKELPEDIKRARKP